MLTILEKKHLGADIHDPKARTSTTLRDFQKLRSEKYWAVFSLLQVTNRPRFTLVNFSFARFDVDIVGNKEARLLETRVCEGRARAGRGRARLGGERARPGEERARTGEWKGVRGRGRKGSHLECKTGKVKSTRVGLFYLRLSLFYLRLVFVAYGNLVWSFLLTVENRFGLFYLRSPRPKIGFGLFFLRFPPVQKLVLVFFTYGSPTVSKKDEP